MDRPGTRGMSDEIHWGGGGTSPIVMEVLLPSIVVDVDDVSSILSSLLLLIEIVSVVG